MVHLLLTEYNVHCASTAIMVGKPRFIGLHDILDPSENVMY